MAARDRAGAYVKGITFASWWLICAAAVVGIVGLKLLVNGVTVHSSEISSVLSPDGAADAVLLDVPLDANRLHSAKVCLRRSGFRTYGPTTCTSIAYLSGVAAGDGHLGIRLEWKGSKELEIRYREARAVYLYYPTFSWPYIGRRTSGSRYVQNLAPIHVRLVAAHPAALQ